ncbi:phosphotransferase [Heliomicrobium modesticaldum]|nr:phosphotransferase [Heliomicrobium modesticaldum]
MRDGQESPKLSKWDMDALQEYPYTVTAADRQGNFWRLETNRGIKAFYRHEEKADRVAETHAMLEHLAERGFRRASRFIRTRDGRPFAQRGPYTYVLTDWLPGRSTDFQRDDDLRQAARTLAAIHWSGAGFHGGGEKDAQKVSRLLKTLADRREALQWYRQLAQMKRQTSEVDRLLKEWGPEFEQKATRALRRVADTMVKPSGEAGWTICHRDWREGNLHLDGARLAVTGWDSCGPDLPAAELAQFLRRVADARGRWDVESGMQIIDAYRETGNLGTGDRELLVGLLEFPQRFWSLVAGHYRGAGEPSTPELLRREIAEEAGRQDFVASLERHLGTGN